MSKVGPADRLSSWLVCNYPPVSRISIVFADIGLDRSYLENMSLTDLIRSLTGHFRDHRIDHAIIGAYALHGYGYLRATADVDFILRLEYQEEAVAFLEGLGFETTHRSSAFSNHLHPVGSNRVDLMYVEGPTADEIFASTQLRLVFESMELPVVSPEHLVALKLFAAHGNPDRKLKELADIREIVSRTEIKRETVWKYFVKYGMEKHEADIW